MLLQNRFVAKVRNRVKVKVDNVFVVTPQFLDLLNKCLLKPMNLYRIQSV